jgi:hypothetical protein
MLSACSASCAYRLAAAAKSRGDTAPAFDYGNKAWNEYSEAFTAENESGIASLKVGTPPVKEGAHSFVLAVSGLHRQPHYSRWFGRANDRYVISGG